MQDKEKAAPEKVAALKAIRDQFKGSSAAEQRTRLRKAFEVFPMLNTQEMRQHLDILHPAGRVKELREEGCTIITLWTVIESDGGQRHRVANYMWVREVIHA
jgi:hypothetical protein